MKRAPTKLYIDNDIIVLANPEIAKLPNWVVALVAAGGLAAALSTAAGLLLVIASAISHDLIKGIISKDISEKGELMWARAAAGVAVIIAGYFGINPPGFVAQVVAFAFGLAASSFFPLIIMGIFWKRATKEGAILGMASGILFTAIYIIYFKFVNPDAQCGQLVVGHFSGRHRHHRHGVQLHRHVCRFPDHPAASAGGPGHGRADPLPEGAGLSQNERQLYCNPSPLLPSLLPGGRGKD